MALRADAADLEELPAGICGWVELWVSGGVAGG
jgi:hypothetical protein